MLGVDGEVLTGLLGEFFEAHHLALDARRAATRGNPAGEAFAAEKGRHQQGIRPGPDHPLGLLAQEEREGIHQHALARAGFAGEDGKAGAELQSHPLQDG